jgi:hypothetical protein
MENSFSSIIENASSILILLPTKPYFDQVAAGLSLYLSLKESHKNINISCPAPMVVEFNRLVGVNHITSELGSKNLTINFANYEASNIEKVSYDIENGEFKLTVVPKIGFDSPKKDQVITSYSGVSADTVILIGGGNQSHFPALTNEELAGAKILHIGIKALQAEKDILSLAKPASSVSELVSALIEQSGYEMNADIATNLVSGIEEGSREFSGFDVSADTFQAVANLMKSGGRRIKKDTISRDDFPKGSILETPLIQEEPEKKEQPPQDWLEPKIYKGTSVS